MVKLNLIVEGGVYTEDVSAETANNAEVLRESLHKFFTRFLCIDDIKITIFMGKGYRNAAKQFVVEPGLIGLFVDSDFPPKNKHLWFERLINNEHSDKSIIIPDEKKDRVFFMIQAMEAWFLKQPCCMDKWAKKEGYIRKDSKNIADHSILRNRNIEELSKPSEKLKIIMKHFFIKNKKTAKYGKLKTAPGLLDALDVSALKPLDIELQRFQSFIIEKSIEF
jgi:hypothetical protein